MDQQTATTGRLTGSTIWHRYSVQFVTLALLYFVTGAIGLEYAQTYANQQTFVTLIWPPAGVAIGLLLRWRLSLWPAALLAEVALSFFISDIIWPQGLGIGLSNAIITLFVSWLMLRLKFNRDFERGRDLLLFLLYGVTLTAALAALAGVLQLYALGLVGAEQALMAWVYWWLGDAAGVLLVGLPLLVFARAYVQPLTRGFSGVAAALLLALALEIFYLNSTQFAYGMLMLPMLAVIWISLTTNLQVSSIAILLFTVIATFGTLNERGVFSLFANPLGAHWLYIVSLAVAAAVIASISMEIRRSLDQKYHALKAANIGTWDLRLPSYHIYFNQTLATMLGRKVRQLEPNMSTFKALTHPDDYPKMIEKLMAYARGDTDEYLHVFRMRHADGSWRWIEAHGEIINRDFSGRPVRICGTHQDITERKVLEDDLALNLVRLNQAQEVAQLGHWTSNIATGELWWSPIIYRMFGLDPKTTRPSVKVLNQLIHPEDFDEVLASEAKALKVGRHDVEHRIVRPDGSVRWVHELATLERDEDGQPFRMVGTVQDITEFKQLELRLRRQALVDELTQVPNRRYMMQRLNHEWQRFLRYPDQLGSFVMMDIDFFKKLNDTYGHGFGDDVLKQVAACIANLVRDVDVFARMGGEEFALLLPQTAGRDGLQVAEKVRKGVEQLELYAPQSRERVTVTMSLGLAAFERQYKDLDAVMVAADEALYNAKENGRNQVRMAS